MKRFFLIVFVVIFGCCFLPFYLLHDTVFCGVSNSAYRIKDDASYNSVDGYFYAIGGSYRKADLDYHALPNFFSLYAAKKDSLLHPSAAISFTAASWHISFYAVNQDRRHLVSLYRNSASELPDYVNHPPYTKWMPSFNSGAKMTTDSLVHDCTGSLFDAPALSNSHPQTNLEIMAQQPVTVTIIAIILWYYYHIWSTQVDPSTVTFSYDLVFVQRQYWRIVTSSFAHFDLMHIGFNLMTLYQLGSLEPVFGSVLYATCTLNLVFMTMLCCGLMYWLLHRFNVGGRSQEDGQQSFLQQQSVGYSCVLFAWMTVFSVMMPSFCPIMFFPQLCFSTYNIPIYIPEFLAAFGLSSGSLPVNAGPLVLLLLTKVIIPRSSLVGHLSGILLGYPLAWGLLQQITPAVLGASLVIAVSVAEHETIGVYLVHIWRMLQRLVGDVWSSITALLPFAGGPLQQNARRVSSLEDIDPYIVAYGFLICSVSGLPLLVAGAVLGTGWEWLVVRGVLLGCVCDLCNKCDVLRISVRDNARPAVHTLSQSFAAVGNNTACPTVDQPYHSIIQSLCLISMLVCILFVSDVLTISSILICWNWLVLTASTSVSGQRLGWVVTIYVLIVICWYIPIFLLSVYALAANNAAVCWPHISTPAAQQKVHRVNRESWWLCVCGAPSGEGLVLAPSQQYVVLVNGAVRDWIHPLCKWLRCECVSHTSSDEVQQDGTRMTSDDSHVNGMDQPAGYFPGRARTTRTSTTRSAITTTPTGHRAGFEYDEYDEQSSLLTDPV